MSDLVHFERIDRLLAGTLPAGAEGPQLSDDNVHQLTLRAVLKVYAGAHPRPPLDRLTPEELARFRLRARARRRP